MARPLVTFRLDQQTYALPLETVIEAVEMVALTPLPSLDATIAGTLNRHDQFLPVVDLRRRLQLPKVAYQRHTPILLAQTDQYALGLVVDEVLDVILVAQDQILHPADILPVGVAAMPLLQGVVRQKTPAPLLLLDLQYLFQPAQVQALIAAILALAQTWPPGPGEPVGQTGTAAA